MKQSLVLLLALIGIVSIQSCGVTDPTPDPTATVESHFFPLDNDLIYTYIRFNLNRYDTLSYKMKVAPTIANVNRLVNTNVNSPDTTLYEISFEKDSYGHQQAILATSNYRLVALEGKLNIGDTWLADVTHSVMAEVMDHYDEYYLPGRNIHFSDVIAVKYHQAGTLENVYTLRFFARHHGLILERQMVGPNTEIASLQLLSVQYPLVAKGKGTLSRDDRFQSFIFAKDYLYYY